MKEQTITIRNEKQEETIRNIIEHINDKIKDNCTEDCQDVIRFRIQDKETLIASAIFDNRKVKLIIARDSLIKKIREDLADMPHNLWHKSLLKLFEIADSFIITKSQGAEKILEYKKSQGYLEIHTEDNGSKNEWMALITETNILKNIDNSYIDIIRIVKSNSMAEIKKDSNNEMSIKYFEVSDNIIGIKCQREVVYDNENKLGLNMTRNDNFSVAIKDKLKAAELYHNISFLAQVLNLTFIKCVTEMIYKILGDHVKSDNKISFENILVQNYLAGTITSNDKPVPVDYDTAVNFQNQLNYMDEKPLNKIHSIIKYKDTQIEAWQSKNYICGTLEKIPHDTSLMDIISDIERTFGVNTVYRINLTYNNIPISIQNTAATEISIEGISKNQLSEKDVEKIRLKQISIEETQISKKKPAIKLKYQPQ